MGQVLQTVQEGLSTDDRVEILERTFTAALTAAHERDIELKRDLEELRKVLTKTKTELRSALKDLEQHRNAIDAHAV